MKHITDVDKNFEVKPVAEENGYLFYSIEEFPFKIYGIKLDGDRYRRIPEELAKAVNGGVEYLHANTAGGRVRFMSDSSCIAIRAKQEKTDAMPHFALTGSKGFDLYAVDGNRKCEETYRGTFIPFVQNDAEYFSTAVGLPDGKMRTFTVNFPLYSDVKSLEIGIQKGAKLLPAEGYKYDVPVVFYGSSITQGGCASRPGSTYMSILSRKFGFDYINLGFSGSARAEENIMEYMSKLKMTAFVYDYDHNADDADYLAKTHERGYKIIREANPDLPIILMSMPVYTLQNWNRPRYEIIKKTYENALAAGDRNVYFVSGPELMRLCRDGGTVDNCHPTDLGFYSMAKALEKTFKTVLK